MPRLVTIWLVSAIVLFALMGLWEGAAARTGSVRFFFSSPSDVVKALGDGFASGRTLTDFWASFQATLGGLVVGALAGSAVGLLALSAPAARGPLSAVVLVMGALPILAVAPMFLIWFGTGLSLKIALAAILAGVVFASQTMRIDAAIGSDLGEFIAANRISPREQARKITVPIGIEWMLAEFPAAANAAFLGVFVGEFIAADRGIGYRILRSGALYQVDVVLAQTLLALLMLLVIQATIRLLRRIIILFVQRTSLDPVYRRSSAA